MTEGPVRDLTQLRDQFTTLRNALAVNDVAAVEAATASLRSTLETFTPENALTADAQALAREVTALSGQVAETLAARLNAFDLVIEALRNEESTR
ncbi:MAG: hypothetical protein FGM26_01035 [Beijerinckiaceae bacterium]|nr:hypothetical protein [Beijerinckiaceae bacterium]